MCFCLQKTKKSFESDPESYQLPGQTEGVKSSQSQLSRLSSFSISKILCESKAEYTRKEAKASPELMKNILDSLPNVTESESRANSLNNMIGGESLPTKKQLRMDVRQTLVLVHNITKNLTKMMGHVLPAPKLVVAMPRQASRSKVEKLPPITRTQCPVNMTATPLEWSSKPAEEANVPETSVVEEKKMAHAISEEKAMRKIRIAELERAKQTELQKLQKLEHKSEQVEVVPVPPAEQEEVAEPLQVVEPAVAEITIPEEEEAKKAKVAELEREARLQKEREANMANYQKIINDSTQARIAQVEQAMKMREEARLAELEKAKKASEPAMESEPPKQTETSDLSDKVEKTEVDEEQAKRMAEYNRVITASVDARIAAVEEQKRQRREAMLAKLEPAEREKEIARLDFLMNGGKVQKEESKTAEMEQSKQDNEVAMKEETEIAQSVKEEQTAAEQEYTVPKQGEEEEGDEEIDLELVQSFIQPKLSHPRPPTPPPQPPSVFQSNTSLCGPQMSLRTINETATCDFAPEFASPLTTHSLHAVVPYQSFRTRFGLRNHETMSDRQLGEEMRKISQAAMLVQNEMLKRKQSKELTIKNDAGAEDVDGKQKKVATYLRS